MTSIDWCLERAGKLIKEAREQIKEDDQLTLTVELVTALSVLDEHYKDYCSELDQDNNEPEGTTYNNEYGPSIEFYIEADDWHEISRALRKLKEEPTE